MKTMSLIFLISLGYNVVAQKNIVGEIFDTNGKRLYYVEDTGEIFKQGKSDGSVINHRVLKLHRDEDGKVFDYANNWEQISTDGKVMISYNFNRREWELVEDLNLVVGKYAKRELVKRTYTVENNIFKTSEQGDYPILSWAAVRDKVTTQLKFIDYMSELGEKIYQRVPSEKLWDFCGWCNIVLVHDYYEKNYRGDNLEKILARRKVQSDSIENTNTIMQDMLNLGNRYETQEINMTGQHFKMLYFTSIEGKIVTLNTEQVKSIKNKWIKQNKDTGATFNMNAGVPAGGFPVSRKDAKKLGIEEVDSRTLVIQIKVKPEFQSEFNSAMKK